MFTKNGTNYYTEDDLKELEVNLKLVEVFHNPRSLNTLYWNPDFDIIYEMLPNTGFIKPKYKLEKIND